ncbi:squalene/phytoene synthase family protein [Acetobacter pasteurianus]|uniref:squalene/phytoene synthase family protein n=2 Tax=Acetobacter TaxID=434 RepID=UPI001E3491CF|nr:squalene/phytoene synthase family protein [Acetobacter pasteurianus]
MHRFPVHQATLGVREILGLMAQQEHQPLVMEVQKAVQADPDRALCLWFLPSSVRDAAYVLLAFHNELIRALAPARSAAVAGPMAGYIRLQWWQEVLEEQRKPEHVLAPALMALVQSGQVQRETCLKMIAAREMELEPTQDVERWTQMMRDGAGAFQQAIGELLGVQDAVTLQRLAAGGAAYGVGSMLRHWPLLAGSGRFLFPGTQEQLRQVGKTFLQECHFEVLEPQCRKAALPAVLAKRDLARGSEQAGLPRGIGDRLAVCRAGIQASLATIFSITPIRTE